MTSLTPAAFITLIPLWRALSFHSILMDSSAYLAIPDRHWSHDYHSLFDLWWFPGTLISPLEPPSWWSTAPAPKWLAGLSSWSWFPIGTHRESFHLIEQSLEYQRVGVGYRARSHLFGRTTCSKDFWRGVRQWCFDRCPKFTVLCKCRIMNANKPLRRVP